jgi:hypothetical protein
MGKKRHKSSEALEKLENKQLDLCILLQNLEERTKRIEEAFSIKNTTPPRDVILSTVVDLIQRNLKPEGKVLNLYEWGSRWFGTAHETASDYDFLAIVTGYDQPPVINVVEQGNIDVALHAVSHFQRNNFTINGNEFRVTRSTCALGNPIFIIQS